MKHRVVSLVVLATLFAACGGNAPAPGPEAAPAAPAEPVAAAPAAQPAAAWDAGFKSLDGWLDNKIDVSLQADLALVDGKFKLTENGAQDWGKASFLIKGLDFDRQPVLEVNVADAAGAKWGLGMAPLAPNGKGWVDSEYKTLLDWQEQAGAKTLDLAQVTGFTGQKDVWIVILVANEGKSAIFDTLKINYTK